MKQVADIHQVEDRTAGARCDVGFLKLRRLVLQTEFDDGSRSRPYACDVLERPGLDAVALVLWRRAADGRVEVLLRECTRPAVFLRKDRHPAIPDRGPYRHLLELVAGIVEDHDRGEEGVRGRAAIEALEEVGLRVDAGDVRRLGGGYFSCPGALAEKIWICAAEVRGLPVEAARGDGSALEEGGRTHWIELGEAIARCARGDIEDAKTEIGLRRLADELNYPR